MVCNLHKIHRHTSNLFSSAASSLYLKIQIKSLKEYPVNESGYFKLTRNESWNLGWARLQQIEVIRNTQANRIKLIFA